MQTQPSYQIGHNTYHLLTLLPSPDPILRQDNQKRSALALANPRHSTPTEPGSHFRRRVAKLWYCCGQLSASHSNGDLLSPLVTIPLLVVVVLARSLDLFTFLRILLRSWLLLASAVCILNYLVNRYYY